MDFGNISKLNLRDIWPKEALYFTPWLAEHINALGETLGMELELQKTEAAVGEFSLDLLAKDLGTGHTVIIENQLTQTDHDHLGKLLTYAAGFGASVVVWVAEHIRDEHQQTLDWLNQRTDEDTLFFGVVVEVIKIDESKPAYIFKPVVSPSEWQKSRKRKIVGATTEKGEMYRNYFQQLIDELREYHRYTNARVGQPQSYYSFTAGITGLSYVASFAQGDKARTELYIDFGDMEKNKSLFNWLNNHKDEIQEKLKEQLQWEKLEDKRASRIAVYREESVNFSEEELSQIKLWHIENLLSMKKAFAPFIKRGLKELSGP
jgi:hypothetical protein